MITPPTQDELSAMSDGEILENCFPQATPYGRAWYLQRPPAERFRMRTLSLGELVNAVLDYKIGEKPPPRECFLATLELDRRARNAGFTDIGKWVRAQFETLYESNLRKLRGR
jgi:hypothetical protein